MADQSEKDIREEFPRMDMSRGFPLFRVHREDHEPWYFDSGARGRFNLPRPRGTCYLATERLTAWVETLLVKGTETRGVFLVSERVADELRVRALPAPRAATLADLTARDINGFGLDREISTSSDYRLSRRWARRFDQAGMAGVLYESRRNLAGRCVALFGDQGLGPAGWRKGKPSPLDDSDKAGLLQHRIMIVPVPSAGSLKPYTAT